MKKTSGKSFNFAMTFWDTAPKLQKQKQKQTDEMVTTHPFKAQKITSIDEDVEKSEPCALLVGLQNGTTAKEDRRAAPQRVKEKHHLDPTVPLQGKDSKELKARTQTDIRTLLSTTALATRAKGWKQPKCPSVDEGIDQMRFTNMCVRVCIYAVW